MKLQVKIGELLSELRLLHIGVDGGVNTVKDIASDKEHTPVRALVPVLWGGDSGGK